ncbi:MAG: hypothetical protein JST07_11205 [Bacteroidetes bacterium]|nr:hypothetical protein [Bacteroidota bacterium]
MKKIILSVLFLLNLYISTYSFSASISTTNGNTCQSSNSTTAGSCGYFTPNSPNTGCIIPLTLNYSVSGMPVYPFQLSILATVDCNTFWTVGYTNVNSDSTGILQLNNSCLNTPNQKVCLRVCASLNNFVSGTGYKGMDVYKYCNSDIPDVGNQIGMCIYTNNAVNATNVVDQQCSNTIKSAGIQLSSIKFFDIPVCNLMTMVITLICIVLVI